MWVISLTGKSNKKKNEKAVTFVTFVTFLAKFGYQESRCRGKERVYIQCIRPEIESGAKVEPKLFDSSGDRFSYQYGCFDPKQDH
jgi:hypothetical protein